MERKTLAEYSLKEIVTAIAGKEDLSGQLPEWLEYDQTTGRFIVKNEAVQSILKDMPERLKTYLFAHEAPPINSNMFMVFGSFDDVETIATTGTTNAGALWYDAFSEMFEERWQNHFKRKYYNIVGDNDVFGHIALGLAFSKLSPRTPVVTNFLSALFVTDAVLSSLSELVAEDIGESVQSVAEKALYRLDVREKFLRRVTEKIVVGGIPELRTVGVTMMTGGEEKKMFNPEVVIKIGKEEKRGSALEIIADLEKRYLDGEISKGKFNRLRKEVVASISKSVLLTGSEREEKHNLKRYMQEIQAQIKEAKAEGAEAEVVRLQNMLEALRQHGGIKTPQTGVHVGKDVYIFRTASSNVASAIYSVLSVAALMDRMHRPETLFELYPFLFTPESAKTNNYFLSSLPTSTREMLSSLFKPQAVFDTYMGNYLPSMVRELFPADFEANAVIQNKTLSFLNTVFEPTGIKVRFESGRFVVDELPDEQYAKMRDILYMTGEKRKSGFMRKLQELLIPSFKKHPISTLTTELTNIPNYRSAKSQIENWLNTGFALSRVVSQSGRGVKIKMGEAEDALFSTIMLPLDDVAGVIDQSRVAKLKQSTGTHIDGGALLSLLLDGVTYNGDPQYVAQVSDALSNAGVSPEEFFIALKSKFNPLFNTNTPAILWWHMANRRATELHQKASAELLGAGEEIRQAQATRWCLTRAFLQLRYRKIGG